MPEFWHRSKKDTGQAPSSDAKKVAPRASSRARGRCNLSRRRAAVREDREASRGRRRARQASTGRPPRFGSGWPLQEYSRCARRGALGFQERERRRMLAAYRLTASAAPGSRGGRRQRPPRWRGSIQAAAAAAAAAHGFTGLSVDLAGLGPDTRRCVGAECSRWPPAQEGGPARRKGGGPARKLYVFGLVLFTLAAVAGRATSRSIGGAAARSSRHARIARRAAPAASEVSVM